MILFGSYGIEQTWSAYLLTTIQIINITINKRRNPPTMMPIIAPMGSPSSNSSTSGVEGTVGVVTRTVDVTDMVIVGLVNTLEGVTTGITIQERKYQFFTCFFIAFVAITIILHAQLV